MIRSVTIYCKLLFLLIGMILLTTSCKSSQEDRFTYKNSEDGTFIENYTPQTIYGYHREIQNGQVADFEIREFKMFNANGGWALTNQGVWRTEDGGITWFDVGPNDIDSKIYAESYTDNIESFFLNEREGWLAYVENHDTYSTYIYHTTDGGSNWRKSGFSNKTGVQLPVFSAYLTFSDAQHGWLLGETEPSTGSNDKYMYRTFDGGEHWELSNSDYYDNLKLVETSLPRHGYPNGITFKKNTTGWVTYNGMTPSAIPIYRSNDGGSTWSLQEIKELIDYTPDKGYYSTAYQPVFSKTNPLDGTLLVEFRGPDSSSYVPYITNDGGDSWNPTEAIITKEGVEFTNRSVYFIDHNGWLLDKRENKFYRTQNGGKNWEEISTNLPIQRVKQMGYSDQSLGWAIMNEKNIQNQLLFTNDGGKTWSVPGSNLVDSTIKEDFEESNVFHEESQLYTTADWDKSKPTEEAVMVKYKIELPTDWTLKNQIIYDLKNKKAGEIIPPILLKTDQTLLEGWSSNFELEFISREDFQTSKYSGQKLIQKVYTQGDVLYVHTYYLQNEERVFRIYFYEQNDDISLDQIVETIEFN